MSTPQYLQYLQVEMIGRAAKANLWRSMRKARQPEDIVTVCVNFYLGLLQSTGDTAENFWSESLGPEIQRMFDVAEPFATEMLDTQLVYRRTSELRVWNSRRRQWNRSTAIDRSCSCNGRTQ